MQKKIIALAVAGLMSGAAFAQTNVTVYGVADLGQAWVKHDGGTTTANGAVKAAEQQTLGRLDNNSSYIGFKGVEDLGGGLKAVFQFEQNVAPDNGGDVSTYNTYNSLTTGAVTNTVAAGTKWTDRDSYVGLAGGFGTVVAGTLTHPLRAMGAKTDILPGAAGFGTHATLTGTNMALTGTRRTGADDRAKNAVAYVSPSFLGGLTVTGAYVNGEVGENSTTATQDEAYQWQVAAQYENGPLYVGLGYHDASNIGGIKTIDADIIRFAAKYTFGFGLGLNFLYDSTDLEAGGVDYDRDAWALGVTYNIGNHGVGFQYSKADDTDNINNSSAKMYTLAYQYSLSKRTMLHARYSKLDNDNGAAYNFYNNTVSNDAAAGFGSKVSGWMVGLRHSF